MIGVSRSRQGWVFPKKEWSNFKSVPEVPTFLLLLLLMLLKLIPPPSQPTIHFSLTLPTFPAHLDLPQSYAAQINHLLVEELEVPTTLHSLDKALGLVSLLDQVTFEIKDQDQRTAVHVTCRFVDGAIEDWLTEATTLISALESIIHNVQESTLEDDTERERERYRQSQLQNTRSSMQPTPLLSMTGSKLRHRKQRSLFMQIVSYGFFSLKNFFTNLNLFCRSIVNLTSSPSSHLPTCVDPSHPESFLPPPPSSTSVPSPLSSNRARLLRRAARSSLVDAYRRHVLSELTRRFPKQGGFGVWILGSMRQRALERMQDLVQEAARLQHHHQQQQVLELRQQEREQKQQERARSPIPADQQPSGPRFSMEEGNFSDTTTAAPLSFSQAGSIENENNSANVNDNGISEEIEDDLETITDGSSVHTPSSTSHIGTGFLGGSCISLASSPPSTTTTKPLLPPKLSPPSPQLPLPPDIHFEYTQLSRLRQRLQSLILFADSQTRIAEEEKRNRDEILLVRGRRRAWLNGELGVGKGIWGGGSATATGNGMGLTQWGFAAPFKSSPLARYSWSASAEVDELTTSPNDVHHVSAYLHEDVADGDEYDEFHGPPVVRSHTHGRQFRRSRYMIGGMKLFPVTEEFEYENSILDVNSDRVGVQSDDYFLHQDDPFRREDEDMDNLRDDFLPEDPRELDLELGFGLQDPDSFIGEEEIQVQGYDQGEERPSENTSRIAFEMERPKIVPRVRDTLDAGDDDFMSVGATSSTTSTRNGGLLRWRHWGVGKNSGGKSDGDAAAGKPRSWTNGIGIGLGSRGRSLDKTCQRRSWSEELEQLPRLRRRVSTSSTSSTTSSSSAKSQQQQREVPAQVDENHEQDQNYSSTSTPLLFQPVSLAVSHTPAPLPIVTLPQPTGTTSTATISTTPISTPTTVAIPPPPENAKDATKPFAPTTPLSFTTKKLCRTSPAPNVYADLDVSVVLVGDDDEAANLGFGANQSIIDSGAQVPRSQDPRLRPRRHKREYLYYSHQQHQHVYENESHKECDEFELAGYGHFGGEATPLYGPKSQQLNPMIHARLHLDELLLEEGLFRCDGGMPSEDQEEFTLAMDLPVSVGPGVVGSGRGGSGGGGSKMWLKQMHLRQNRDRLLSSSSSFSPPHPPLNVLINEETKVTWESSTC